MISFTVPGDPVGKGRPRMTRAGHAFTPAKTRNSEAFVKLCATQAMAGRPLVADPVVMSLNIRCAIPHSWSQRKKAQALTGELRPGRPDIDNIAKLVADALNGVVLVDDKQICALVAHKMYAREPGIDVVIALAIALAVPVSTPPAA